MQNCNWQAGSLPHYFCRGFITSPAPKIRWLIFLGLAALALAVRLPRLAERPMHTDEAVNAYITGQLLATGNYHYDNQDRHGPALYAVAYPLARLCGAEKFASLTETTLRLGPVLVGTLTIFLFALAAGNRRRPERRLQAAETSSAATASLPPEGGVPTAAALVAALLWTFAPLPLFYSRYFIHETFFVAATFGLLLAGWRWLNTGALAAAALTGLCAALMLATKETAIISFAAAAGCVGWWWFETKNISAARPFRWPALLASFAVFALVLVLLFSWGGRNWQGLADLFHAAPKTLARAGGQGHAKPAWYYLQLLANGWFGPAFLALTIFGGARALKNPGAPRLCLIYAVIITGIYSAIPYKTPWLALNLWLPFTLLAASGAAFLWQRAKNSFARAAVLIAAAGLAILLAHDTRRWCFQFPSDERNPYVYAHTGEDIARLPERLGKLAKPDAVIAVIAADAWPLPWYLRHFRNVGYWQLEQTPGPADFYITSSLADAPPQVAGWRPEIFGWRPGVLLILWSPPEPAP